MAKCSGGSWRAGESTRLIGGSPRLIIDFELYSLQFIRSTLHRKRFRISQNTMQELRVLSKTKHISHC